MLSVRFLLNKAQKRFLSDYSPRLKHAIDHGLYNVNSVDNFYRDSLDLKEASTLLSDQGLFWEAYEYDKAKGASSLDQIKSAKSHFLHARNVVFDREELTKALKDVVASTDGRFVLLLGGKSTGKTITLQSLKDTLHVNGRDVGSLSTLLGSAIPTEHQFKVAKDLFKTLKRTKINLIVDAALTVFFAFPLVGTTSTAFNAILRESPPDELLKAYLGSTSTPPTIIIDEFNRFLSEESKKEEIRLFLELLVQVTKESNKCKVILASSEHSFPYRLNLVADANYSQNATDRIFAGEVPPNDMFDLLTKKWGMGSCLASVFIACYGGHIWNCAIAVDKLLYDKEKFRANSVLGGQLSTNVAECVDSKLEGMNELLKEVARVGFAAIPKFTDPLAKIGSQYNVLGVVDSTSSLVIGVPRTTYQAQGVDAGVVPASQSMRLVIASKLSPLTSKQSASKND